MPGARSAEHGAVFVRRWQGPVPSIDWTDEERAWIAAHPRLRFVTSRTYVPVSYVDEREQYNGLANELLVTIADQMGIALDPVVAHSWQDQIEMIKRGDADIVTLRATKSNLRGLVGTRAYFESLRVIFTRKGLPFISAPADLYGRRLAWVRGGRAGPYLAELGEHVEKYLVPNQLDGLYALQDGRADAMIANYATGYFQLRKYNLDKVEVMAPTGWPNYDVGFGVRADMAILRDMLDKGVASLQPAIVQQIRADWLAPEAMQGLDPVNVRRWGLIALFLAMLIFGSIMYVANRRLQKEITDRRAIQRDLEVSRQLAQAASDAKSTFLAHMSHELRTPLNAIIGFSELIVNQQGRPLTSRRYQEYNRDINDAGHRLLKMIEDILDVARIERNVLDVELSSVDLRAIVSEVIAEAEAHAARRNIQIAFDPGENLPPILANSGRTHQVVGNILSNAIKYSPDGGLVTVDATAPDDGKSVELTITDQGDGIPADMIDQITQPFFRRESELTHEGAGLGTGMSIVAGLVRLMRAELRIESAGARGTRIQISFRRFQQTQLRMVARPDVDDTVRSAESRGS